MGDDEGMGDTTHSTTRGSGSGEAHTVRRKGRKVVYRQGQKGIMGALPPKTLTGSRQPLPPFPNIAAMSYRVRVPLSCCERWICIHMSLVFSDVRTAGRAAPAATHAF